jgi:hypothetical protein
MVMQGAGGRWHPQLTLLDFRASSSSIGLGAGDPVDANVVIWP